MTGSRSGLLSTLGPGLLFAGAAVGVSHLVQSTRAGADYGFALVGVILLANFIKYPAFSFGPRYAAATGTSLLEGYRRQGKWALVLYGLLTFGTMFTVQAAVTLVTAALLKAAFGLDVLLGSVILTVVCTGLLWLGHYPWLERAMKLILAVLTLTTLAATVLVLPEIDWGTAELLPSADVLSDAIKVAFLASLIGWMPSAIDISVWQSLWSLAKNRKERRRLTVREVRRDFDIGYVATAVLAICFVVLGATVMHGTGQKLSDQPGAFAGQVMTLFTTSLGDWSYPLIATAAITVMFSTTLTVVDGFPRALGTLVARLRGPEQHVAASPGAADGSPTFPASEQVSRRVYYTAMTVLGVGSLALIGLLLGSLKAFVDVATALSFCTAAPLSWLNHRAITGPEVPVEARPGPWMRFWSWIGIAFATVFTLWYLWVTFGA